MILALDLGLTQTGVCRDGDTDALHWDKKGVDRLCDAYNRIGALAKQADKVAIEGYSYNSQFSHAHTIGELGGVARLAIAHAGHEPIIVAPASLKKYALGKGNANKAQMVSAATERAGHGFGTEDEADAWWLWAFVCDLGGKPAVKMPKLNRSALEKYR